LFISPRYTRQSVPPMVISSSIFHFLLSTLQGFARHHPVDTLPLSRSANRLHPPPPFGEDLQGPPHRPNSVLGLSTESLSSLFCVSFCLFDRGLASPLKVFFALFASIPLLPWYAPLVVLPSVCPRPGCRCYLGCSFSFNKRCARRLPSLLFLCIRRFPSPFVAREFTRPFPYPASPFPPPWAALRAVSLFFC